MSSQRRYCILQNGFPRSGNVWLNYLLHDLIRRSHGRVRQFLEGHPISAALEGISFPVKGIHQHDFLEFQAGQVFWTVLNAVRLPVDDLPAYCAGTDLVATHTPYMREAGENYRAFSHHVCIIRDPRDVCLSMARFMTRPEMRRFCPTPFTAPDAYLAHHGRDLLAQWHGHVASIAHLPVPPFVVFYEKLLHHPAAEIQRLADHLGLACDTADLMESNDLRTMQQRQPSHTDSGGWGKWRDQLHPAHISYCAQWLRPTLQKIGYPIHAHEPFCPERLTFTRLT